MLRIRGSEPVAVEMDLRRDTGDDGELPQLLTAFPFVAFEVLCVELSGSIGEALSGCVFGVEGFKGMMLFISAIGVGHEIGLKEVVKDLPLCSLGVGAILRLAFLIEPLHEIDGAVEGAFRIRFKAGGVVGEIGVGDLGDGHVPAAAPTRET